MPRRAKGPRLYFQDARGWVIRDGTRFIRVGSSQRDAEKALATYIGQKHKPAPSNDPWIADILNLYLQERVPHQRSARNNRYQIGWLLNWWGTRRASEINKETCKEYAATKTNSVAGHGLRLLAAAVRHWHGSKFGPLGAVPSFTRPKESEPRDRWLTRTEAARLLSAAKSYGHIRRLVLLGLYTGSRPGVILSLKWSQIDLNSGVLLRTPKGQAQATNKRAPPVKLGRKIAGHLRRWKRIDGNGEYVCHWQGRKVRDPHDAWRRVRRMAGLEDIKMHTLRHTSVTWRLLRGDKPWDVAAFHGMTVKTLDSVYGHHHPDYQADVADL